MITIKVVIDADGCPVVHIAVQICQKHNIEVIIVCDTSHYYNIENVKNIVVDKGSDSADFKIVNILNKDDIVITQDYGLAAICLAKKTRVISQNGMIYNDDNIDALLMGRYAAKKIRESGGRLKGNSKRTSLQDKDFINRFTNLILS